MIESVEEGIRRYKGAYKAHRLLGDDIKVKYGEGPSVWESYDRDRLMVSTSILEGMAFALCFSKEERKRIEEEAMTEMVVCLQPQP